MKTTKRDLIQDLDALVADIYAKADDYLRSSKAYTCRGNSEVRAGLVKGAAVMRIDAGKVQAIIDKHKGQAYERPAVEEESEQPQAQSRDVVTEAQPSHQDSGQLDVPGVSSYYGPVAD